MNTQLKVRTEFSFRTAYGPISKVAAHLQSNGCECAAITDRNSTFGHYQWQRYCKQFSIKPIYGVELGFTPDTDNAKAEIYWLSLLARSNAGLKEIYSAVEEATASRFKLPRLPLQKLDSFTKDVIVLSGNSGIGAYNDQLPNTVIAEAHSATNPKLWQNRLTVPISDNFMIRPSDRKVYEIVMGQNHRGSLNAMQRPQPIWLQDRWELQSDLPWLTDSHFTLADTLGQECNATLAKAENIKANSILSLRQLCMLGVVERNLEWNDTYQARLDHELALIKDKGYEDYFFVIADMVQYAKQHMLVGPARGSSAGSLCCYLVGITDIDPIPHGLIFERFIDVTRTDLPDIDIDFQDDKRELVFEYLQAQYGSDKVARLGTVSRYKTKMAIGETGKALRIPDYDLEQLKFATIARSPGDEGFDQCIADTFINTDYGRQFIAKYPEMTVASEMEYHVRHSGKHAAGVVITNEPIINYVAKDTYNDVIQIDKYDAEAINLMKVDALGLRTLTVIADCLEQIGWTKQQLLHHRMDDDVAFKVLRDKLFCGVFQFEGEALQNLTRAVPVERFDDLSALTALARPGPLIAGSAKEWVERRQGKPAELIHDLMADITSDTFGLIVYQEQMLRIIREIGCLSWEDCTLFRRGINKKLGMEYFDAQWWEKFKLGAASHGIDEIDARKIWETVNGAGGYAFNKSHSVAYALVSYWTMILKGHFPLEFALATLKFSPDPDSIKMYLRELDRAGYNFKPFDAELSEYGWSVKEKMLIGGLTNVVGIGPKTATRILTKRQEESPLTVGELKLIENAKTPFDNIFEMRVKFAELLADPVKYGIVSKLTEIIDINDIQGDYVLIAKLVSKKIRSSNEPQALARRQGLPVSNDKWLALTLEDDTGTISAAVSRKRFSDLGQKLLDASDGHWFLWRGWMPQGMRRIYIEKYRYLGN